MPLCTSKVKSEELFHRGPQRPTQFCHGKQHLDSAERNQVVAEKRKGCVTEVTEQQVQSSNSSNSDQMFEILKPIY